MNTKLSLFVLMSFYSLIIFAQDINTAEIKAEIVALKTTSKKQAYLTKTRHSDQNNRRNGVEAIDEFNKMEVLEMSLWESPEIVDSALLNDRYIERRKKGDVIKLMKKANGKNYLQWVFSDNSGSVREVEAIADNKYKYAGCQTDRYYELHADKVVLKTDSEVIKEFYAKKD